MHGLRGILRWLIVAGLVLIGLTVIGTVFFFHWMSIGELHTLPPGGAVTVALGDSLPVRKIMTDICQNRAPLERLPTHRVEEYQHLLRAGNLVRIPDGTPVTLGERGSLWQGTLSSFTVREGPWRNKSGWACPNEVIALHPFP